MRWARDAAAIEQQVQNIDEAMKTPCCALPSDSSCDEPDCTSLYLMRAVTRCWDSMGPQTSYNTLRALAQFASVDSMRMMNEQKATRALTRKHLHTIKLERGALECRGGCCKMQENEHTCNQPST